MQQPVTAPASPSHGRHARPPVIWLLLPTLISMVALVVYPLARGFYTSLTTSFFLSNRAQFVGFRNYAALLHNPVFWMVVWHGLVWTVGVVLGQLILGFVGALILNQPIRGQAIFQSITFIPWIMPGVAAGLLWSLMYDPTFGLIGNIQHSLGLSSTAYLSNVHTSMAAVVVAAIWKGTPFTILMMLAGLQTVDTAVTEAARIDGASWFKVVRHAVIPQVAPVLRTTALFITVWTFNYFDMIYVMTNGGPVNSTQIFPTYVYQLAFGQLDYGLGTAAGILSLVVVGIIAALFVVELSRQGALD